MKNITVSIDEATYLSAKEWAAKRGTSVSALVREYLNSLPQMSLHPHRKTLGEVIDDVFARGGGIDPSENVSREELHDRDAFR